MTMTTENLCDDEGCPHHGTPHVCTSPADAGVYGRDGKFFWRDEIGDESKPYDTKTEARATMYAYAHYLETGEKLLGAKEAFIAGWMTNAAHGAQTPEYLASACEADWEMFKHLDYDAYLVEVSEPSDDGYDDQPEDDPLLDGPDPALHEVCRRLSYVAEGYRMEVVGDGRHLRIENPHYKEDNGENPWLVIDTKGLENEHPEDQIVAVD